MMIKLFSVSILVMFVLLSQAQIVIDQSDLPQLGDTVRISTGINLDLDMIEETGANYTWDFSDLIPISQQLDTFVNPMAVPIGFWFLNTANQAKRLQQDLSLGSFELTNTYGFYKNAETSYNEAGFTASIDVLPIPFKYETPDVLFSFPLSYGSEDSSNAYLAFGLDKLGYIMVDKKRHNYVDGWGSLITPYGVFETIRLRSEVVEYDSIYIDSLDMGVPVNRIYTEYKWLGKGHKWPLLTITKNYNVGGVFVQYVDSVRDNLIDIPEINYIKGNNLSLYPNPVHDRFFLEYTQLEKAQVVYTVYDLQSNMFIQSEPKVIDKGEVQLSISSRKYGLKSGVYIVLLHVGNQYIQKKFMIE